MSTLRAATLDTVSTIKNSASTTVLTTNTSEPLLTVGTGANTIKARNTAKWWIQCTGYLTIANSYGVASLTDNGGSQLTINYSTPAINTSYAIASSYSHYTGVTWDQKMNYATTPGTTSCNFRFSYGTGGAAGSPSFGWGAIGFGDQT